jgi:protein-tyrosine phosphatase
MTQTRVLFVCLGNICRSPTAEGVFRRLVADAGLADRFVIDSAGTGDWHVGEPPDPRMQAAATALGYPLDGTARQVRADDFAAFDHILAMDRSNLRDLVHLAPAEHLAKIGLLRQHDPVGGGDVPDPYYSGPEGFTEVVRIIERSCNGLLAELTTGGGMGH